MTPVETAGEQSALVVALQHGVEAGATAMVADGRLAGPATVQEDVSEIVPAADAVGAYCTLADGSVALVLLVVAAAEELSPGREGAALAGALSPVLEMVARSMGQAPTLSQALSASEIQSVLVAVDVVVAAGVFDGPDVIATVVAASGADSTPVPSGSATMPSARDGAPSFNAAGSGAQVERGLQILADVNLEVTAELGRTSVSVSDLLDLEPGAVLELTNPAGSPVDLFVNGTLFARAEVVVVNESYAVRIAHLVGDDSQT